MGIKKITNIKTQKKLNSAMFAKSFVGACIAGAALSVNIAQIHQSPAAFTEILSQTEAGSISGAGANGGASTGSAATGGNATGGEVAADDGDDKCYKFDDATGDYVNTCGEEVAIDASCWTWNESAEDWDNTCEEGGAAGDDDDDDDDEECGWKFDDAAGDYVNTCPEEAGGDDEDE